MDMIIEETQLNDDTEEEIIGRRGIIIKTISLENIEPPKKIIVKVELNEKPLGKSDEIFVQDKEAVLNWEMFFEITEETETVVGELITHPLVFTILCESILPLEEASPQPKKGDKGKKKNVGPKTPSEKEKPLKEQSISNSSKKTTKLATSKSATSSKNIEGFPVLGVANLDIIPLLSGEEEIEEVLFINPTTAQKGCETIAWANLPKLKVLATGKGNVSDEVSRISSNVLSFTMESLNNISPDCSEDIEAASILPNNGIIKFKNGTLLLDDSVWISNRKKWYGLRDLPGQGALSIYKVSENTVGLLNTMDYEVTTNSLLNKPRIQWNQLHRSFLNEESEGIFKEKIMKYNCWPVEILIHRSSSKSGKQNEGKKKTENVSDEKENHYITFLDLSKLIYPGEKAVRLASQLYTYTQESMNMRFGDLRALYEETAIPSDNQDSVKPKTASSNKGSSKSKGTKKGKMEKIEEQLNEDESVQEKQSDPVVNDDGEPIFIVVEINLLKPLVEKQEPEKVLESIDKLIPKREQLTPQQISTMNTSKMYEECIMSLIHNIHDEYQIFFNIGLNENKNLCKNFLLHLHVTGAYAKMVERMKEAVAAHIWEAVGPANKWEKIKYEHQDLLTSLYQEMANKMYAMVNSFGDSSMQTYEAGVTCDNLKYYVSEAIEEGDYDKAHEYILLRLEKSERADPQEWIDFAKYWKKKLEFEKAEECAKEAISLDPRHKNALFFYGLLSWLTEDYDVAEMFLLAVVAFHPYCLEGWATLHMIHKQMGKQREAGVELSHAKQCASENLPIIEGKSSSLLTWCAGMAEKERIFLITAAQMLSLSFPDLAELALSYDLLLYGCTIGNLYYLAVCHYHQGRHINSLVHLEEGLKLNWEDDRLWALKGHNLYKLQKLSEAKEAYNIALNFKDQEDQHLIYLRLGNILLKEGDHKGAAEYYMMSCRDSPTPLSWLGLGIATFMDDDMEGAELALSEANMLDCKMGRVWAYLALVNLIMDKPFLFNKCIVQALKYGFEDQVLLERIDNLVKLVQPMTDS